MPKLISTGLGGCISTNSKKIYEGLLACRNQGISPLVDNPSQGKVNELGFNFKFTDIQASLGIEQMKNISQIRDDYLSKYDRYQKKLSSKSGQLNTIDYSNDEIPLRVELKTDNIVGLANYMSKKGIETSLRTDNINCHPFYKKDNIISLENSSRYENSIIVLPSGPGQTIEDIDYTCQQINNYFSAK